MRLSGLFDFLLIESPQTPEAPRRDRTVLRPRAHGVGRDLEHGGGFIGGEEIAHARASLSSSARVLCPRSILQCRCASLRLYRWPVPPWLAGVT